jgi:hypothetical protein
VKKTSGFDPNSHLADFGRKLAGLETNTADLESNLADLRTSLPDLSRAHSSGSEEESVARGSSKSAAEERGRAENKIFQCQGVGSSSGPITAQDGPGRT